MLDVVRLSLGNRYRNFNYLIGCSKTGLALAIDPLDIELLVSEANKRDWNITNIICTHEHLDHAGRILDLAEKTGAHISASRFAIGTIPNVDRPLGEGDLVSVGVSGELSVLETPGHTMLSIGLLSQNPQALFCGDTLFVAGVGNCQYGGHLGTLWETVKKLKALPEDILVYPGHDYAERNLLFTLSVEPDNFTARDMLLSVQRMNGEHVIVTTIGDEKRINCFFRTDSESVRKNAAEALGMSPVELSDEVVFSWLRKKRDEWNEKSS